MEGNVSAEEPKSSSKRHKVKRKGVKKKKKKHASRGTDASLGGEVGGDSKPHQVKGKERASRVQSRVDASHGQMFVGPDSHLVKCKRIEKKHLSRVQGVTDASQGEMGEGSEPHQVKRKRVKKDSFSWLQGVTDASQGEMGESSKPHQVNRKRVKKDSFSWLQRGTDTSQGDSEHHQVEHKEGVCWYQRRADASQQRFDGKHGFPVPKRVLDQIRSHARMNALMLLENAKLALELYEKSQDAEFEILKVLYSHSSRLRLPESEYTQLCVHMSFIAKPKNSEGSDASPKHLFAELMRDGCSMKLEAQYCTTFEPSNDPGFDHGCMICPPKEIHPGVDGYHVGRPPWYKVKAAKGRFFNRSRNHDS